MNPNLREKHQILLASYQISAFADILTFMQEDHTMQPLLACVAVWKVGQIRVKHF
jgi:hypothetical protein